MKTKKTPMRMCSGCREMKPKIELIRVVRTPEGKIMVDNSGKVSGRGAYVCKNEECLKKLRKTKGLERSLKIAIPQEVYDKLEKEMELLG